MLGKRETKKANPWQLLLLLFQMKRFLHISMVKRLAHSRGPPAPQLEQIQEHGVSAMPEEGIYLRKYIYWSMNWQPNCHGPDFLRLKSQLPLGSLPRRLLLLCTEMCHVFLVMSIAQGASGCAASGGRGAGFHSPLTPSSWLQGCRQPHNDTYFPCSAWPAKCILSLLSCGLKSLQLCRAKQSPRCYQKH